MDEMLTRIFRCLGSKRGAQKDLANYLGIHPNVITNWKNGSNKSYRGYVNEIADYLGVPVDFFLSADENADTIINDISQYQALLSWTVEQDDVSDRVKDVIQSELPKNTMSSLAALSQKAEESSQEERPTPVAESGPNRNILKLAGRDGSYVERNLTDEQLAAVKMMIEQLPDANDL